MRRYLPTELRRRFNVALSMVPDGIRPRLLEFIRYVKAPRSMQGLRVALRDGSSGLCDKDVGAWFLPDTTRAPYRAYVFIRSDFEGGPEEDAVVTALHELAHAVEYLEDDWRAEAREGELSDLAAWLQAGAWAARSSYRGALPVTRLAWHCAADELRALLVRSLAG